MTINDPRDISGLKLWLSAEYETAYSDNDTISTWQDISGNANHATTAGTPKWRSAQGPGSGPCVEFTSSLQSMTLPDLMNGETEGEIFATARSTAGSIEHGFWKFGTAGVNNHYPYSDNLVYDDFGSNGRKDAINVGAGGSSITSWHRVNTWSKASDWSMQINESTVRSTSSNTVAWNSAPKIGSQSAGGAYVAYACIVLYDRKLTSGERSDLIAWLTANPNGGAPVTVDPPGVPDDVTVTPDVLAATLTWTAPTSGGDVDGYEVRLDGGTIVDAGLVLTYEFTGLTPDTSYDFEVRAYGPGGESDWVLVSGATLPVPPATPVIYLGPDGDMVEVFPSAHSVLVRRGLSANGVTENLEPGVCTIVFVDDALNPLSYDATRPGRPVRVGVDEFVDEEIVFVPIFTGTIDRGVIDIDKETGKSRLVVTAFDAVPTLAGHPYTTAHAGTFSQRVTPVLEDAGVEYVVHDDDPDEATGTLLTNQQTALGQLLLARDTMHGFLYVDRFNVVQAYADDQRSRTDPVMTLTDGSVAGSGYVAIDPGFDTDDLVNVLTIETLDTPDNTLETFTDEDSVTAWKKKAQTVVVNDLEAEFHWLRFTARINGPGLTVKQVRINSTRLDAFATFAALELYEAVRVVRDGLVDQEQQVVFLEHQITHRIGLPPKWMVTATTRKRELLPLRWMDVPDDITWADLDPALTWNSAIYWHP